ncbi:MAG: TerB family tellurite resistance protein [Rhizobiales bacterium]|nr:TerB family tellurite resistance protein [Hyphomicrobiales bacterium]
MHAISPITEATGKLFALVALSDGNVRDIENTTAERIIECLRTKDADAGKYVYETALVNQPKFSEIEGLCAVLKQVDRPQQYEFLRSCWYLALCDKELNTNEEIVIFKIGDLLGISRFDSQLAKKSATLG